MACLHSWSKLEAGIVWRDRVVEVIVLFHPLGPADVEVRVVLSPAPEAVPLIAVLHQPVAAQVRDLRGVYVCPGVRDVTKGIHIGEQRVADVLTYERTRSYHDIPPALEVHTVGIPVERVRTPVELVVLHARPQPLLDDRSRHGPHLDDLESVPGSHACEETRMTQPRNPLPDVVVTIPRICVLLRIQIAPPCSRDAVARAKGIFGQLSQPLHLERVPFASVRLLPGAPADDLSGFLSGENLDKTFQNRSLQFVAVRSLKEVLEYRSVRLSLLLSIQILGRNDRVVQLLIVPVRQKFKDE